MSYKRVASLTELSEDDLVNIVNEKDELVFTDAVVKKLHRATRFCPWDRATVSIKGHPDHIVHIVALIRIGSVTSESSLKSKTMNWSEYLPLAEKTMSLEFHAPEPVQRVLHGVIGICTEIGELYEGLTVNKPGAEFDLDHPDVINLKEEIGDCYWYLAIVHREFEEFQQPDPDTSFTPNKGVPTEFILRELTVSSSILLDLMKKKLFYNKTLDIEQFVVQTRHIEYYLECLTLNHDLVKEEILETNINKLKARYGEKFSSEKAIERNLDTERTVLEGEALERSGRSLAAQANETATYFDKAGPANFKEGGEAPSIDSGYKTSLAPLVEGEVIEAEHKIGIDFSPFKVRLKKITNDRYVRFAGWRCVINDLDPETKIATMVMLNNKADNFLGYFKKKEETE